MVSVIVPVYNVEKYLPMCIESILSQTYKDFELILVDDNSNDNSLAVCNEYAGRDSRIKVIHQDNTGVSGARNTGIAASKGDYIFFVDSDDCVDERLLEVTVKIAELDEYKAYGMIQINQKTVADGFVQNQDYKASVSVHDGKLELGEGTYEIKSFNLIEAFYNLDRDNKQIAENIRLITSVVWGKLYRRAAFKNLRFPEDMRIHEDQMMIPHFIQESKGMVFVDVPLYFYRQADNDSLIRVGWNPTRLAILDCYEDRLACAIEINKQEGSDEAQKLTDYIYYRTLVCFFRNYCVVSKKVDKENGRKYKRDILSRVRCLLKKREGKIGFVKRAFFYAFTLCPAIFVLAFNIRNK